MGSTAGRPTPHQLTGCAKAKVYTWGRTTRGVGAVPLGGPPPHQLAGCAQVSEYTWGSTAQVWERYRRAAHHRTSSRGAPGRLRRPAPTSAMLTEKPSAHVYACTTAPHASIPSRQPPIILLSRAGRLRKPTQSCQLWHLPTRCYSAPRSKSTCAHTSSDLRLLAVVPSSASLLQMATVVTAALRTTGAATDTSDGVSAAGCTSQLIAVARFDSVTCHARV